MSKFCLLTGFLVAILSGCYIPAPMYAPEPLATPYFREQGQLQVTGQVNSPSGGQVRVAASPFPHVGLMASGFLAKADRHRSETLGAGGMLFFSPSDDVHFTLLGGHGAGDVRGEGRSGTLYNTRFVVEADYARPFVQLNVSATVDRNDDADVPLGMGVRLSHVQLSHIRNDGEARPDVDEWFVEPAFFMVYAPFGGVEVRGQLGFSFSLSDEDLGPYTSFSALGALGLTLRVDQIVGYN